ncbi:MAG: tRNA (adenosine(37)-N6)-dimethylallyltransferase MiaA [Bacteroidales bacterium]|nr:tRNA (adenosine(37)-N6)-dimethylallyltransferase MiaA [Bacteroidales bacterium]
MVEKVLKIILGPTAVGKTAYAINLARQVGSPVISCDSRQIFKEMTIGTAVPSKAELSAVRHYFIQTKSITEHYAAGQYEIDALKLLEELFKTHDHLVMCGGSGLYIDAVCNGLDAFPEPDMELRDSLNRRLQEEGLEALRYQLKQVDPESYETIDIANPQRVVRALEVTIQTGRKYSDWKTGNETTGPEALPKKERPFRIEKIGLAMDREKLYDRINRRVEKMMEDGLLDEVRALDRFRYKGNVFCPDLNHIPPLRTVGYRELFDYLDGKTDLDTAVESIKRNTRRYAKRQMSYWGRDKSIKWKEPLHR